ncbi:MAG TPA: carboxymuconolactone decarboxylase family protein [Chitinivibrionales bacterium]|nr:carboxymuconolactone decarboxylase family protein [Chitinivibrionales bacterium]
MNALENQNAIFPKGEKTSSNYFTGTAWLNILVPQDETGNYAIGNVVFEPGCRNNWHKHPAGQILLVTDGKGFYQEKGKPARLITKGDTVVIPSHTEHWHGAASDSSLTHIAITNNSKQGAVEWLLPVTDEEYYGCQQPYRKSNKLNLTAAAIRNHQELFSNHQSALKITDPELIEAFDNFAFDEVLHYGNLDTRTRLMMILGSTIASQALGEYKVMLGGALNIGVTPVEAKEILYQAVPYVGMAKVFDFIHATNEILANRGVQLPLEGQSTTSSEARYENGLALQKSIFGEMIDKLYKDSPSDQIHIQRLLSANCFGDYLTRKGLSVKIRELLTFSMLLSLGGCEHQVTAHIQGNLNVGNDKGVLLAAVTQLIPFIGYPRALNALRCLNEVN